MYLHRYIIQTLSLLVVELNRAHPMILVPLDGVTDLGTGSLPTELN